MFRSRFRPLHPTSRTTTTRRYRRRRPITHRRALYRVPRSVRSYGRECVVRNIRYALAAGDGHTMTSTAGALSTDHVYRANGCYDPYALAGGGQPRFFDQMTEMYRNWVVLGSKITLFLGFGAASSTSSDMQVSIVLKDGSTAVATAKDILEAPRVRTKLMTAGQDNKILTHKYSYKMAGNKSPLDNENLWGTASADPTEQFYYHILAYQPGGGTEAIHFTGWIDFNVIFFHALLPTAS